MPSKRKSNEATAAESNPTGSSPEASTSKKPKYKKTVPDVSKEEFLKYGKPLEISFGPDGELSKLEAEPTSFNTGSFGWKMSGKIKIMIDVDGEEKEVTVSANLNMVVNGSKPSKASAASSSNGKKAKTSKKARNDDDDDDE